MRDVQIGYRGQISVIIKLLLSAIRSLRAVRSAKRSLPWKRRRSAKLEKKISDRQFALSTKILKTKLKKKEKTAKILPKLL